MKKWVVLVLLVLFSIQVSAQCEKPIDGKAYTYDRKFCSSTYYLPDGISIERDNLFLDCNHAVLRGDFKNPGITIKNRKNITVKDCHLANYGIGVHLHNSSSVTVYGSTLMRNTIGMKLVHSSGNFFDENNDISLERPIKIVESFNNTIKYINKDLKEDYCRYNKCNVASNITFYEHNYLISALQNAINFWITGME